MIVKGAIVGGSDDKPRSPLTPEQILAENTALRKKIGQQDKLIASFQRQLGGGAPPPLSLGGGPSSSSEWGGTPRDHLNLGIGTSGATDPAIAAATFLSQHSPPQQPSFSPQGSTASSGPTTGAADIIENGESLILGFPVSKASLPSHALIAPSLNPPFQLAVLLPRRQPTQSNSTNDRIPRHHFTRSRSRRKEFLTR